MSTETKRAQTVYGDVDFETRTCASCGQEYLPEDTTTYYYGKVGDVSEYSSFDSIQFEPSAKRVYFCEMCHDVPTGISLSGRRISVMGFVALSVIIFALGLLLGGVVL